MEMDIDNEAPQSWMMTPVMNVYGIVFKPEKSSVNVQHKILLRNFLDMINPMKFILSNTPVEEFPFKRLKMKYCNLVTTPWSEITIMDPNAPDLRIVRYSCNVSIFNSPSLNLVTLSLFYCELTTQILSTLLELTPNLKKFECELCTFTGCERFSYSTMYVPPSHQQPNLESMKFSHLPNVIFFGMCWSKMLGTFPNLKTLYIKNLESPRCFNHILKVIKKIKRRTGNNEILSLTQIEPLVLADLTYADIDAFRRLAFPLKTLKINAANCTNRKILVAKLIDIHKSTLKNLHVETNKETYPVRFPTNAIPSTLSRLEIKNYSFINLNFLRYIPNLEYLNLNTLQNIWHLPFADPPFVLAKLKTFIYASDTLLADYEVQAFSKAMPNLTGLDIQLSHFNVFQEVCSGWKHLRKLGVTLPQIQSDEEFATHIIQLQTLENLRIVTLREHGFGRDAIKAFRKLKSLNRLNCSLDILTIDLETLTDLLTQVGRLEGYMPRGRWGRPTTQQYIASFLQRRLDSRWAHVGKMAKGYDE